MRSLPLLLCLLAFPVTLRAIPIASFTALSGGGSGGSSITFEIGLAPIGTDLFTDSFAHIVNVTADSALAGQTIVFDADDVDFTAVVALLTNGQDDVFINRSITNLGGGGAGSDRESGRFFGDTTGGSGIDLAGHAITAILVTFNSFEVITFSDGPGTPVAGIRTLVNYTLTVHDGTVAPPNPPTGVPEGGNSLILFLLGLSSLQATKALRRISSVKINSH
jgi:hypothetical protein